jgi:HNH endonuclease/NUMOD4 motif
MEQVWKIVPNTNNLYEASNFGMIRRCLGTIKNRPDGGVRKVGGKILSQKTKKNKYKEVSLYLEPQVGKMMYVHRLVYMAFVGDIPNGMSINHIDGNKANNNISNLELVTPSQNMKHAFDMGLSKNPVFHGSNHGMAKLTEEKVLEIRDKYSKGIMPKELSKQYPIPFGTICKICYRKTWKHI